MQYYIKNTASNVTVLGLNLKKGVSCIVEDFYSIKQTLMHLLRDNGSGGWITISKCE